MTDPKPDAGSGSGGTVEDAQQQFQDLIDAHRQRTRWLFAISCVTMVLGLVGIICGAALGYAGGRLELSLIVGILGAFVASLGLILLFISRSSMEQDRGYLEELRVEELRNYSDQQFERARLKIQHYMHENLKQVHSIYGLTALAMILGFVIILAGVALAYWSAQDDAKILPSVVATLAGVVVQFIGSLFSRSTIPPRRRQPTTSPSWSESTRWECPSFWSKASKTTLRIKRLPELPRGCFRSMARSQMPQMTNCHRASGSTLARAKRDEQGTAGNPSQ